MDIIQLNCQTNKRKYSRFVPTDIVKWGKDNLFPDEILYLYFNSPTQQGILNRKMKLTAGQSYTFSNPDAEFFAKDIDFANLFSRSILDFYLYNAFSLQIIERTFKNEIADVQYQDTSLVRLNTDKSKLSLSANWSNSKSEILTVDKFDLKDDEINAGFLFYTAEMAGLANYPNPSWFSGIKSIETEIALIENAYQFVSNAFMPSGILKLPSKLSPEEMSLLREKIKSELTGAENTGKIMTVQSDENKTVEWIPLAQPLDASGVQGYLDMVRMNIIIANSLTSPTILGLPAPAGLGDTGGNLEVGLSTYFTLELLPVQNKIKAIFEQLFKKAGVPTEIIIENQLNYSKTNV